MLSITDGIVRIIDKYTGQPIGAEPSKEKSTYKAKVTRVRAKRKAYEDTPEAATKPSIKIKTDKPNREQYFDNFLQRISTFRGDSVIYKIDLQASNTPDIRKRLDSFIFDAHTYDFVLMQQYGSVQASFCGIAVSAILRKRNKVSSLIVEIQPYYRFLKDKTYHYVYDETISSTYTCVHRPGIEHKTVLHHLSRNIPTKINDNKLVNHIISTYFSNFSNGDDTLKKFIQYACENSHG